MMEKPIVIPGQWINIEGVNSVVCHVSEDAHYDIEVVSMDKGKAGGSKPRPSSHKR